MAGLVAFGRDYDVGFLDVLALVLRAIRVGILNPFVLASLDVLPEISGLCLQPSEEVAEASVFSFVFLLDLSHVVPLLGCLLGLEEDPCRGPSHYRDGVAVPEDGPLVLIYAAVVHGPDWLAEAGALCAGLAALSLGAVRAELACVARLALC